ncbi:ATP-binding protein [Arcobacter peruensis]|uniref:ATP-binding protein n=1 Tax=Arcobacter peruensis TaxID=2320140 RepID=UPI000F08F6C0|nr:ATP-binding protein [Arcobacter peruensis]
MKTLENCYELNFSKINFIERKIRITHPKTIITGASKTGKSYLIYDFLSNFKSKDYIYIDLKDSRNNLEEIIDNLDKYLRQNQITVLVLENFSFEFELPYCDNVIISTNTPKSIRGFKNITVSALDFEEYLLHDNRHQNITQSFNNFFKYGNLPEIINIEEHKKVQRLQEIIKLQAQNDTQFEILKLLFENIDEKKSLYQLFTNLKNKIKISKDKFYETCKTLEINKTIYFVEKYNQEKANKKIYSYNHSFLNSISHHKKFKNEFTNMIFLELIDKYKNIYYLDNIDFYIKSKKLAIVGIPFFNSFLVKSTLRKIYKIMDEYEIKELNIITVSNDEKISHDTFKINVIPFYEWALS